MIRLATVIATFEVDFLAQYRDRLTADHYRALAALQQCRTQASRKLQVQCTACPYQKLVPGAALLRPSPLSALPTP